MIRVSSQDFRNLYEKFYSQMRLYLWPYQVLEELADVECDIYSAFIDIDKLSKDFGKLQSSIREACKDDEDLRKLSDSIRSLIDEKDVEPYARLYKVAEVNPETAKQIRTIPEEEEESL